MAFRVAAAPAARWRAWLAVVALLLAVVALLAAAGGFWAPGGGGSGGSGALTLRGSMAWASGVLSSGVLPPGEQSADTASASGDAAVLEQQQGSVQPGGANATRPQLPPLCGGPSKVRRVADSLAASGEALMEFLEESFKPYEQGFGLEEIKATAAFLKTDAEHGHVHTWIEVYNKTVTYPHRPNQQCLENCDGWFHLLKGSLDRGMREGRLVIPEGVPFLVNVNDDSWCPVHEDGRSKCTAPLLSIFKSKFDHDVLIPNFKPEIFEPIFHPWESKKEIAFFRGAPICSMPSLNGTRPGTTPGIRCSRWVVAELSWEHPELINATLTENVTQYGGPLWVDMPRVSHQEAAAYKYLLAVDGSTAAYRFAFLMATNSVVLKQVTDKIEWYYAAVHRCEHYLPFWVDNQTDVLQLVQQLQGNHENDLVAQAIAANSQAFALTYLSPEYAFWYWQKLVDKYMSLYRGPKGSGGSSSGSATDAGSDGSSSSTNSSSSPAEASSSADSIAAAPADVGTSSSSSDTVDAGSGGSSTEPAVAGGEAGSSIEPSTADVSEAG